MKREMNYKDYLRRLLILAVPIILSNVISQVQMLIDRIFLGHADNLYMSALGNASSSIWTTMSVCFSLGIGASILISQSVGAGNKDNIEEYAGALIKYNSILPVLLFLVWIFGAESIFHLMGVSENLMPLCVSYATWYAPVFLIVGLSGALSVVLQTSNYTLPMVFYGVLRAGLNIVLDYALIFGELGLPKMGIKGAAIATTIAEYAGFITVTVLFLKSKKITTLPSFKGILRAKIRTYFTEIKLGICTALEDFAWNAGNLVMVVILNTINEMAAGIYSIIFGIEVLAVVIVGSVGSSNMTLSSEAVGMKNKKQYIGTGICAYLVCIVVIVAMLAAALICPEEILALFTADENVISTSAIFLLLSALNLIAKSGNIIVGNSIRATGNTMWMLGTQIFGSVFVVSLASLFVFVFDLGIAGVFFAVMADEAVRCLINFIKCVHIVKNWKVS